MCNLCGCQGSKRIFTKKGFHLAKCLSCGLVYAENKPSSEELRRLYSFERGYHNYFADPLSRQSRERLRSAGRNYKYLKRYKNKGRVLDVGCSAGFFLRVARENGWEPFGIEISGDTAEIARERYGLNVLTGELGEDTFPAGYFDAVTLWDIIEHVADPLKTMTIAKKVLKDDGIVLLSTPNIDGLFPKMAYRMSGMMNDWLHPEPPHHLYQFSKKTMSVLLDRAGFAALNMHDKRIPFSYIAASSGLLKGPLSRLLLSMLLMPVSLAGPMTGAGDLVIISAEKRRP